MFKKSRLELVRFGLVTFNCQCRGKGFIILQIAKRLRKAFMKLKYLISILSFLSKHNVYLYYIKCYCMTKVYRTTDCNFINIIKLKIVTPM